MSRRMILACIALALCLGGCSGLGGEPEIVATYAPPTTAPTAAIDWQPDVSKGGRIFAERCTECHGSSGDGRGDLVAGGSVPQPLDMTDLRLTAAKSPLEWFQIITEGRIENLMPPWENALSEDERWDVTLYAYSLAYDETLLSTGDGLWREHCGDCQLPLLIPPVYSDLEYGAVLNAEFFNNALDGAELAAAVAHARMRTLRADSGSDDGVGDNNEVSVRRGDFSGRVQHGTADGKLPRDTIVQLQFGSAETGFSRAETMIDEDGRFAFEDIPLTTAFSYIVSAMVQDRLFSRRLLAGHPADIDYEQTITIYDLTHDPSVISVASIELYINPIRLDDLGSGLLATQIVSYRNDSDRLYTSGRGFEDGREASLLLQVPDGARIVSGDGNGRFVIVEDLERVPDSLIDTQPVTPGDGHQIVVEYFLPYDDRLDFEQLFNNRVNADVSVTLPKSLHLQGADFTLENDTSIAESLRAYAGKLALEREPRLAFVISGDPYATSSTDAAIITSDSLPPLLAALGATFAVGLAGLAFWRRRGTNNASGIDDLVGKIAQLDEAHDRGHINHDVYHHRRRELKRELADLMDETAAES